MTTKDDMFHGLDETVVATVSGPIALTREDARAIGRALIAFLEASGPAVRDDLLPTVEGLPGWIDGFGTVRIGNWVLSARGDDLVLTYRSKPEAGRGPVLFVAALEQRRPEGWVVTNLDRERLIPRR